MIHYVIVGAGSAGCVLANRLTDDPTTRVILIEAGGRDWNPLIHIPVGYMKLLDHKQLTWCFTAEADQGTNGRATTRAPKRASEGSGSRNPRMCSSVRGWRSNTVASAGSATAKSLAWEGVPLA